MKGRWFDDIWTFRYLDIGSLFIGTFDWPFGHSIGALGHSSRCPNNSIQWPNDQSDGSMNNGENVQIRK